MNTKEADKDSMRFVLLDNREKLVKYLESGVPRSQITEFHHYTNIESAVNIIKSGYLWLSRCEKMNELLENDSGDDIRWDSIFMFSLLGSNDENIGMWSMYGQPWKDGVKITIPKDDLNAWMNNKNIHANKNDEGIFTVNGGYQRISDAKLYKLISIAYSNYHFLKPTEKEILTCAGDPNKKQWFNANERLGELTGYIKNAAWSYEREARIFVYLPEFTQHDKIAIKIPERIINNMRITEGPLFDGILIDRLDKEVKTQVGENRLYNNLFRDKLIIKSPCATCSTNSRKSENISACDKCPLKI